MRRLVASVAVVVAAAACSSNGEAPDPTSLAPSSTTTTSPATTSPTDSGESVGESWTTVEQAPLAGRFGHTATAAEQMVVVWGGVSGRETFDDGAAYDVEIGRWRKLPPAPLAGRTGHTAV